MIYDQHHSISCSQMSKHKIELGSVELSLDATELGLVSGFNKAFKKSEVLREIQVLRKAEHFEQALRVETESIVLQCGKQTSHRSDVGTQNTQLLL